MKSLLALVFLSSAALAQSVLYSAVGEPHSQFGCSADAIDDVDFDGVADVVVGARADGIGGAFHVFSGASGSRLYSVAGSPTNSLLGSLVSRLGDVNGDGAGDYFVLSHNGVQHIGRVSVRSGIDGSQLHAFDGDFHAFSPADDLGDANGDGKGDYVLGSMGFPNASYAGRVWVRSGADGSLLQIYTGGIGSSAGEWGLGRAVAGTGDLDGDGLGDFAYSSQSYDKYFVHVRSGATGALIRTLREPLTSYNFGSLLASAGDVDVDGVPDLLVGRETQGWIAGELHVYSGASGLRLYTVQGLCAGPQTFLYNESFPRSAAALGDLNGDGHGDFGAAGSLWCHVNIHSGADGSLLAILQQPPLGTGEGGALIVAGGADLDLDGRNEVLVGHMPYTPPGTMSFSSGRLRVYDDVTVHQVGIAMALGDGTGAPCPCGNTGQTGAGCANASGLGAVLTGWGSASVAEDELFFFRGEFLPISAPTCLIASPNVLAGGLGAPFGNGLMACGPGTRRVWPRQACPGGQVEWGSGMNEGFWSAGEQRVFQAWYRDELGPCGGGSNVTNAVQIQFVP